MNLNKKFLMACALLFLSLTGVSYASSAYRHSAGKIPFVNCEPAYKDNGDGSVKDKCSKLIWQKSTSTSNPKFAEAVTYCDDLVIGRAKDWRLPTASELATIVDYNGNTRMLSSIFTNGIPVNIGDSEYNWTSTIYVPIGPTAHYRWVMDFTLAKAGAFSENNSNSLLQARCVRDYDE